ncbi:hypothetical protein FALBO_2438 [Fusarium albosuccineum]|uniref:Uncharacterized protein n=1 Tax=Fusarium albosuccineum TaxID=1237068 RepID=A0A8H4LJD2_9HYPO|nr:hypothetical protein FALBO_2438 [Fusarium albosuccineum]
MVLCSEQRDRVLPNLELAKFVDKQPPSVPDDGLWKTSFLPPGTSRRRRRRRQSRASPRPHLDRCLEPRRLSNVRRRERRHSVVISGYTPKARVKGTDNPLSTVIIPYAAVPTGRRRDDALRPWMDNTPPSRMPLHL